MFTATTKRLATLASRAIAVMTLVGLTFSHASVFNLVAGAKAADEECSAECQSELAAARAATARYHNIDKAQADGFVQVSPCVALPTGAAMGFHYAEFSRIDFTLDASVPETLLYVPNERGQLKLVGLEYIVPFTGSNAPPTLFGQTFEGPFFSPFPHYELHVWAWKSNRSGTFTDWNPAVTCDEYTGAAGASNAGHGEAPG